MRAAVEATARSVRAGRPVVFAMGGHVVKVGMSPLIIDLMQRGLISALAVNGSFAIHDMEIALIGRTSERIEEVLPEDALGPIVQDQALGVEDAGVRRANLPGDALLQLLELAPGLLQGSIEALHLHHRR